jgi:MFS-type transporter involved in bile tolerance (Atg22 family)
MQRSVRPEHVGRGQGLFMLTYYTAAAFSGLLFASLVSVVGWSGAGFWQLCVVPLAGAAALLLVEPKKMIGR